MIVGITGHQDLGGDESIRWVRGALDDQLSSRTVTRGLSSLARGADQLFVDVLVAHSIPYVAVIPCAGYEMTFDENARSHFTALLNGAESVDEVPYPAPSEQAFLAAGKWIVDHCDLLLAVWDGEPAAGPGGTGDVVALARSAGISFVHIDPQRRVCKTGS